MSLLVEGDTGEFSEPFYLPHISAMSEIRYETPYTQNFYHKGKLHTQYLVYILTYLHSGVNLSPQEHAQGRMDALRTASVEAAKLDPNVGSVQYGTEVGNGVGSDWAVVLLINIITLPFNLMSPKKTNGVVCAQGISVIV